MSEPLKWGILATGVIDGKFATDLESTNRGILVATGSRSKENAENFATKHGGKGYGSYDEVLADPDVEAVYNSPPNHLHKEWTIKALRAGKHVLCEKPIALNATEAEEMFRVAEESGKVLVEAFMYRLRPVVKKILETVRSGVIGDVRLIRSNFTFAREADKADARYHAEWGGGSFMDIGAYSVNFCRAVAGSEPTEIHAVAHMHEHGVDDYAAGLFKFGDNILATFTAGMTVMSDRKVFIAGTKGRIMADQPWFDNETFELTVGEETTVVEAKQDKPLYTLEAEAFADVVQNGVESWTTMADTLGNMRALDELRRQVGLPVDELGNA